MERTRSAGRPTLCSDTMDSRIKREVLIIAADCVVGALLGVLVEISGDQPRFSEVGETPLAAIERLRAPLVLIDCDHDAACEDAAYEAASRIGSEVILFGHEKDRERIISMGKERDVHTLSLPVDPAALGRLIDHVLAA